MRQIRSKAEALRVYARQAKDRNLELDAAEIRFRAERRLGQMIAVQKKTVGLAKGSAGKGRPKKGGSRKDPPKSVPTLAEVGIDKYLADRARKMAVFSDWEFEQYVLAWRKQIEQTNTRVTTQFLKKLGKATDCLSEEEIRRRVGMMRTVALDLLF